MFVLDVLERLRVRMLVDPSYDDFYVDCALGYWLNRRLHPIVRGWRHRGQIATPLLEDDVLVEFEELALLGLELSYGSRKRDRPLVQHPEIKLL